MAFSTNISDVVTRIGTEFKTVRTMISGSGTGDVSGLTTTATNLVGAINEIDAAVGAGSPTSLSDLDDVTVTSPLAGQVLVYDDGDTRFENVYLDATDINFDDTGLSVISGATVDEALSDLDAQVDTNSSSITTINSTLSNKQDLDSNLTAISALTTTAYGRNLLELADTSALGAQIDPDDVSDASSTNKWATAAQLSAVDSLSSTYQPLDSDLTAIAAVSTTSYGRAFLALANQAALMALVQQASTTVSGKVELATTVEATTGTDTTRAVTPAGLQAALDALVDSAPGTLDTLNELAAALGDDPNFASTVTTSLAGKQPLDADLTAIAALVSDANKLPYATGTETWELTDLSAFGRSLIDDANASAARTTLGLGSAATSAASAFDSSGSAAAAQAYAIQRSNHTGTQPHTTISDFDAEVNALIAAYSYQPLDADLTSIAGLTSAANKMLYATGANTWALADLTAAGRALLDDASATAQRATLSVYSQAELGDPDTNYVTVFEGALA